MPRPCELGLAIQDETQPTVESSHSLIVYFSAYPRAPSR